MRTITVNGKEVKCAELTFNNICVMQEKGVDFDNLDKTSLNVARVYLAISMKTDLDTAGNLIEEHVLGGGDLSGIMGAFAEALDESGFFRTMLQRMETEEADTQNTEHTEK